MIPEMKPAIRSFVLCGAAVMLFAAAERPAQAQWGPEVRFGPPRIVAPYERETIYREIAPYDTLTIARSTGLRPVGRPVRRGANYELLAVDTDGVPVRVTIDARAGRVLNVHATGPVVAPYRGPPREFGRRLIEEEPVYSGRRDEDPRHERRYDETIVERGGASLRRPPAGEPRVVYGSGEDARSPLKPKPPEKAKPKKTASTPAAEKPAAKSAAKNPGTEKAAVQPVVPAKPVVPQTASTPAAAESRSEQGKSGQVKSDAALTGSTGDVSKSASVPKPETPAPETQSAVSPKVDTPKSAASENKETQGSAAAPESQGAPETAAKPDIKSETELETPAIPPSAPPVQTYE